MTRAELVTELQARFIPDRVTELDTDFLEFELEMGKTQDLELVLQAHTTSLSLPNPHNSCILYAIGCTDVFDFGLARAHTIGGSPPDIDTDFESLGRDKVVDLVAASWGRDNVANIIAHGTFKPKSLTRKYFKITDGDPALMTDVLGKIRKPIFGKEATLDEIIDGEKDEDGQYSSPPHPELRTDARYAGWLAFAEHLEGMVANFGIHAAGVVISDFPIYEQVPMWKNAKSERITQYDMAEIEELGMIKFDFLSINNLDILKECARLVEANHGIKYDPWAVPDGDPKAYALMHKGLLSGIFQMETSKSAKDLIMRIRPTSISELSDISALNRPGPLEANFHEAYIANKQAGRPPGDMPAPIAELLKGTYWTLVYQEQLMQFVSELAGFSLRETDDVRRAMGKKKMDVLQAVHVKFVEGCVARGMEQAQANHWWSNLLGFANYGLT